MVIQGPTGEILSHVAAASCGFVHVDASHEYEAVRTDLRSARRLLKPGGVVALDDYRAAHTPGTAAAVWEAVANDGLRPVCVSADKFYGMWGNARPLQDELVRLSREHGGYASAEHHIMGCRLVRVVRRQTRSANGQ